MKKLNKLLIDSEKLMKNEELIALRGGYPCTCSCCGANMLGIDMVSECRDACTYAGCQTYTYNCF
jgi:hypothetical protein